MTAIQTQRLYNFEEYLAYDDGTDNRYELVDGRLGLMNPPTFRHLLIADFIQDAFKAGRKESCSISDGKEDGDFFHKDKKRKK